MVAIRTKKPLFHAVLAVVAAAIGDFAACGGKVLRCALKDGAVRAIRKMFGGAQ